MNDERRENGSADDRINDNDKGRERETRRESKPKPSLSVETLEPRILLSATWVDADTGDPLDGPTAGDDMFTGHDGIDDVHGLGGDDVLNGMGGNDRLFGDAGDDVLSGGQGDDLLRGGDDNDSLSGGLGTDTLHGDAGDDVLAGDLGDDTLYGGAGHDTLDGGEGNDTLAGGQGDDQIDGGMGIDTATYTDASSGVEVDLEAGTATGGAGNDTLTNVENVTGSLFNDTLSGDDAANELSGSLGDDVLHGGAGNDTLDGGEGNDTLHGGQGDDTLVGGEGEDTATYHDAESGVNVNLAAGTAVGGAGNDTLDGIENVAGSDHDDMLIGDANANVLDGGAGDDVLVGGHGDDTLIGGLGHDTADYSDADSGITVDMTTGTVTGGAGNDTLVGIEHVVGSAHDDTFAFASPAGGSTYSVDGGDGTNIIDLSNFSRDDATFDNGTITIDLGDGQSFTVEHSDIDSVTFSDADVKFVVWDGGGSTGAASDAANWAGDTMPDSDDIVIFDGTSAKDAAFGDMTVGGLQITADYGGDVTLSGDFTVDGDLVIESGTFNAGGHDLRVDGDLHIEGGQFTASAGTTEITGDLSLDGGTFRHNNGTLAFTGDGDQAISADGGTLTLDNLSINKADGTLTMNDSVEIRGDYVNADGDVDASGASVEFTGYNATIRSGDTTFGDVTFHASGNTTIDGTMDVNGDLRVTSLGKLNGGDVLVAGNITTTDTSFGGNGTIVLDGAGDQVIDANGGTGELHHLSVNKPDGSVMLNDRIEISGNFNVIDGDVDASDATVVFQGYNANIAAGNTNFGDVTFNASGNTTVDGIMDVNGDLTITSLGNLNGGEVLVAGNITTTDTSFGGNGTIVLDGAGDQVIDANGGTGELHHLSVNKPDGNVTFTDNIQLSGDYTLIAGTVDASGANVEFQGYNATITAGATNFGDVTFNASGNTTIDGTMDVNGDLTITSLGNLNGGDVLVAGNITTTDTSFGGNGTIVLDGSGDQVIDANGGTGELHHLSVNKPDGNVTFTDNIQLSGDYTLVNGTVDASGANVEFQGYNATITAGATNFGDVTFNASGNTTISGTMDVNGDLTITSLGNLNGGDVLVAGNITTTDTSFGGNGTIVLDGSGDQVIDANGGTGELHHLSVNKPDGSVTFTDNIQLSGDYTLVNGTVDASGANVEFQGYNATITAGATNFGDVTFNGSGNTTIDGTMDVNGDLTITSLGNLNGGEVLVAGNITTTDTSFGGNGTIVLDGSGDQVIDANGGTGELHHLSVNKPDGNVTFTDNIQLSGDYTLVNGTVDASGANVEFQGYNATITAGATNFGDVTFNASGNTTISGTMDVNGDLTITSLGNLNGGDVLVAGNITTTDTSFGGNGTIVLDGTGDQLVSANGGTGELHHLTVNKSDGTVTLGDRIEISGNFNVINGDVDASDATVVFQGYNANINADGFVFGDLVFDASGTTTFDGDMIVAGDLTIQRLGNLNGGTIYVGGEFHEIDSHYGGTATIVLGLPQAPTNPVESPNQPPVGQPPSDEAPSDEAPTDETPNTDPEQSPGGETPADEAPADEAPDDEAPDDAAPVDETPTDEAPSDETPVDESPADETPVDDIPADVTPTDTAPTDGESLGDHTAGDDTTDDNVVDETSDTEVVAADDSSTGDDTLDPVMADDDTGVVTNNVSDVPVHTAESADSNEIDWDNVDGDQLRAQLRILDGQVDDVTFADTDAAEVNRRFVPAGEVRIDAVEPMTPAPPTAFSTGAQGRTAADMFDVVGRIAAGGDGDREFITTEHADMTPDAERAHVLAAMGAAEHDGASNAGDAAEASATKHAASSGDGFFAKLWSALRGTAGAVGPRDRKD